jgi:membrane associated rhomboid family serine protease
MNRRGQFLPLKDDNPRKSTPFVTWGLIAANVIVFIFTFSNLDGAAQKYGFIPASFSFVSLFTCMFLHGSIMHILGNMWFLFIFGDNVEDALGKPKYVLFYLVAGVAAGLSHYLLNLNSSIPAVGASGAISGVLGAYLVFFPNAGVYVSGGMGVGRVNAKVMLLLWFGFQLLSAFLGADSGIAFFAHIGGFAFGVLVALIVKKARKA